MRVLFDDKDLTHYMRESVEVSHDRPVLLDRYLNNAIEVDVDALCDGQEVRIAGVMEHIERAGVHSGDSSCCIPPPTLPDHIVAELESQTKTLALALKVRGLLNVQFAVTKEGTVYVLEANPRASRTVPFVSKATGIPWAKLAALVMSGRSVRSLNIPTVALKSRGYLAVKACVFPFNKFNGVDTLLGPEMKSTGEVMGIHRAFSGAFAKSQAAAGIRLPKTGNAFLSVSDSDKEELTAIALGFSELGFSLIATSGTATFLKGLGFSVQVVNKVRDGSPHIVDMIAHGDIQIVVNTPEGAGTHLDSRSIRTVAHECRVPTYTTMAAALAAVQAIQIISTDTIVEVTPLQEYHGRGSLIQDQQERIAV